MTTGQDDWNPLKLLADAPEGAPTIYCVHGGGGDLDELKLLAEALKGETRFYGLDSRGLDGVRAPFETYEEEAASIVNHICAQDPGPYILAGYSAGGAIAFEVAQQMSHLGRKIELIMMFDSVEPGAWTAPFSLLDGLRLIPQTDRRFLIKFASERLGYAQAIPGQVEPQTPRERVYIAFLRSQDRYISKPYAGEIFLVRALSGSWRHIRAGKTLGWGSFVTGRIEVCQINCEHHELILPPKVFELARVVRERLKRLARDKSALEN